MKRLAASVHVLGKVRSPSIGSGKLCSLSLADGFFIVVHGLQNAVRSHRPFPVLLPEVPQRNRV